MLLQVYLEHCYILKVLFIFILVIMLLNILALEFL